MDRPPGREARDPALARVAALLVVAVIAAAGVMLAIRGLGSVAREEPSTTARASIAVAARTAVPAPTPSVGSMPSATQRAPADPVLVGAGDIGRCDGDADEATAALLERTPGIVFTLGDNAYETGSAVEYRECLGPSWGRVRERIGFPVPGNHDWKTAGAAGYLEWFGAAAAPAGTTWYARDVGAWRVVVLDSTCGQVDGGCGPDSPQVRWLREELGRDPARCTLALFHHPRFSSGEHGSDSGVAPFWDELYAAGADLVLNGHEHSYERFGPQDPAGRPDRDRGITELVVGTGGAPLRGFGEPVANSRVRAALAHGVLALTLRPSGWTFRFESVDGSFTDQGAGTCH